MKLLTELTDKPELYDFRFGSGVVREDDGVDVFLGRTDGDLDEARTSVVGGGGGRSAISGGIGCCMMDRRFILLVSVGLIVLAPRPVAWDPGMTDIRFPGEG